jgi:hypothetical protein
VSDFFSIGTLNLQILSPTCTFMCLIIAALRCSVVCLCVCVCVALHGLLCIDSLALSDAQCAVNKSTIILLEGIFDEASHLYASVLDRSLFTVALRRMITLGNRAFHTALVQRHPPPWRKTSGLDAEALAGWRGSGCPFLGPPPPSRAGLRGWPKRDSPNGSPRHGD